MIYNITTTSTSTPLPRKALKASMRFKLRPRRNVVSSRWFDEISNGTTSERSLQFYEIPSNKSVLMPMLADHDTSFPTPFATEKLPSAIRPRAHSDEELSDMGLSMATLLNAATDIVLMSNDHAGETEAENYSICNSSVCSTPKKSRFRMLSTPPPVVHRLVSTSSLSSYYELSRDQVPHLWLPDSL